MLGRVGWVGRLMLLKVTYDVLCEYVKLSLPSQVQGR